MKSLIRKRQKDGGHWAHALSTRDAAGQLGTFFNDGGNAKDGFVRQKVSLLPTPVTRTPKPDGRC